MTLWTAGSHELCCCRGRSSVAKEFELHVVEPPNSFATQPPTLHVQPICDIGGICKDAVIKAIDPSSPCAGLVGLGDQLVAINGYRIA